MSGQTDGRTSRSSTSSRPSAVSSSLENAPSPSHDHARELAHQAAFSADAQSQEERDGDAPHDQGSSRKRQRRSGGFLLSSAYPVSFHSPLKKAERHDSRREDKGKDKAGDGSLVIPKRRSLLRRHHLKHSIGSSPLAKEIVDDTSIPELQHNRAFGGDETLSVPSKASSSIRSSTGSNSTNPEVLSKDASGDREIAPALNFDTDAAKLVNLALSLGESRRRNFTGGLLAPHNPGDRRVLSTGDAHAGIAPVTAGGILQQHLHQQQRTSQNTSQGRHNSGHRKTPSPRPSRELPSPITATTPPTIDFNGTPDSIFSPSDATLSRVEKARVALELGYEYRRLLQYLPKIPARCQGRPTTGRLARKENDETPNDLGRPYNPLQYVRNRKVRLRERRALNPEADGWDDVIRVRNWIDVVAGEREAGIATIDDRYPLPPFDINHTQSSTTDFPQLADGSNATGPQTTRPRRPRLEWIFTPSDLLADAYWLQHDGNITHIEDRMGHKIVSSPQSYEAPSARSSVELEHASHRRSESISRQAISSEKFRSLVDKSRKETSRERGSQQTETCEPETPARHIDVHKDRKSRWPRRLVRSQSTSSMSGSDDEDIVGYNRHRRRDQNYLDSAALEKHMKKLLEQENEENSEPLSLVKRVGQHTVERNSRVEVLNHNINGNIAPDQRSSTKKMRDHFVSRSPARSAQPSARASLEEQRGQPQNSTLGDSTDVKGFNGPDGSHARSFVPSIAVDVSRPSSPPSSRRKLSPARKGLRLGHSKERQEISEQDFATKNKPLPQQSKTGTGDTMTADTTRQNRMDNATNGFLSPITAEGFSKRFGRSDGSTAKGTKESREVDSRLRGFFKGGRIAEIVGNEVSRVGDKFWRRDASNPASPIMSPASSVWGESDTEGDGLESSPETDLSRVTTSADRANQAKLGQPKYHMDNLPSFRSPFVKDKDDREDTKKSPNQDTKPQGPLQQRGKERSSRFERLAPPKLDMRNVSPSVSPPLTRTQTRNTVASYDPFDSRQSSTSRSEGRVRDADRRLNAVLGVPGTFGRGGPPITGLAILESHQRHSRERPRLSDERQWSIADRSISATRGAVTKHDVACVKALLLSSGVKANEIARRAHEISQTPSPLVNEVLKVSKGPLPRVSRAEEYNLAAKVYGSNIDNSSQQVREAADRFSNETLEDLYNHIKYIDEQVTQKLTPSVRTCADEADAFSAQLTTTHVLEVKQLNDSVDAILRRRRRRFRWVRRSGYVLLEWTLLGIMWWVWLIVVVIRLARGTLRGLVAAIKWLLWL